MTPEQLKARIESLMQERERLIGRANACQGAIEDCQYWLSQLDNSTSMKEDSDEA